MTGAAQILRDAAQAMEDRAKLRDSADTGERSMARAVEAFNALMDPRARLTEQQGWLFMCCLKMARGTAGAPHLDDAVDLSAYAALWGESMAGDPAQIEMPLEKPEDAMDLYQWSGYSVVQSLDRWAEAKDPPSLIRLSEAQWDEFWGTNGIDRKTVSLGGDVYTYRGLRITKG